ncbi:solute:sodium symporter family transporter [Zobellia galactanivorans]|uniref:solute:sodium symporter family transporter n=1 Tax=Zobellia galactanivorans (strain DSM 12802 / CCUG 47099 / CIP 106680 / NCIMB 13871 / Dsij) TaxID=63186 RepID=UPI001C076C38|nr:solute:sodium symporter family transporter [Zobellia galactanivorans]MBU3026883.1 solute:sodium symporter family transporter [Zobellia galactanivorans]MDO6810145.1 solute:sodium symporter family transporter [Zobellia galactanivorans]
MALLTFLLFTGFVAFYATYKLRRDKLNTKDGYFLGGRSLTGVVIAGSLLLTNISTEHLVGMNGSAYRNGAIIVAWEVTSALALVIAALYFAPRYLKMGLTTIPEFLEKRFDGLTRTLVALLLIISFVATLLPIVLYTGALNIEAIFDISELLNVTTSEGIWITIIIVGSIGAVYAIFGGLKMVAYTDTINGFGLLVAGLLVPTLALLAIGDGNILEGMSTVFRHSPEKFNVISHESGVGEGARSAILPFEVLFTGLMVNQIYFWTMHQSIIQRVLGAVNLKEAQKGLLFTGLLKILVPLVIVLPGLIGFYYFGESLYDNPDNVYPLLVKKVLPLWLTGFFVAVMMGAILSTFNSALNSAATVFSLDIFKKYIQKDANEKKLVVIGKSTSAILAILAIGIAPFVANAPDGLYQLLQQLNGIFFIPIASVIIAGFLFPRVTAAGAKAGLGFGLLFYVFMYYVLEVNLHFIHIWGIEFVLNIAIMHIVSALTQKEEKFIMKDAGVLNLKPWRFAKPFSFFLILFTIILYLVLGNV